MTYDKCLLSKALVATTLSLGLLLGSSGCDDGTAKSLFLICPVLDLVFVMDTSGSMEDEADALCDSVAGIQDDLEAEGIAVNVALLASPKMLMTTQTSPA